jgi:hypothetical protein
MNGTTLKAIRQHLFFSLEEAARMVGSVSPQGWSRWEGGLKPVPKDAALSMRDLVKKSQQMNERLSMAIQEARANNEGDLSDFVLITYITLDDWMTQYQAEPIDWRLHCSLVAKFAAFYPNCRLVPFNSIEYSKWLNGKADNSAMRAQWAAGLNL